jgi:hypothetical protein
MRRFRSILLVPLFLGAIALSAQENAPRLAGIVDLDALSLLWDDSGGLTPTDLEPLDIAATPDGPVILFSDRYLSLGLHLEMTERTVQDVKAKPVLPTGYIPSRLLINPLLEPIIYSAESGMLLVFHRDTHSPERFETNMAQPLEVVSQRRGGLVLSDGQRLHLFSRRGNELSRREIILPSRFTTGLSTDDQDRLWVYDIQARKVRVFDQTGSELFTISPDLSGGTLLFPQVFLARADGGFFLGSAGELWCFDAEGLARWRLTQFSAGYRQGLPAFYRLARAVGQESSFYILDPLGNRILKFIEDAAGAARGEDSIDSTLAAGFAKTGTDESQKNEILRFCLEAELYLQAAFFQRSRSEGPVVTDLAGRIRSKQARLLSDLARRLENELRLIEAEVLYNRGLNLYRELRSLDPVDPRYPEAIRDLSRRRNGVRNILTAEGLLAVEVQGHSASDRREELQIVLGNISKDIVEQVEIQARFDGYPDSRWLGSLRQISTGGRAILTIPFSGSAAGPVTGEDLRVVLNVVVKFLHDQQGKTQYFQLPLVFPAGSLRLPRPE